MRTSLGVSAGTEVVCAALLTATAAGGHTTEYRVLSADEATTDLGDLVASSIELMTTQISREQVEPSGIAVAYRTKEQTDAIRSAASSQRRDIRLVPESAAAYAYLQQSGHIARYRTVAVADFGASGFTVTMLDPADGTVLECERTSLVSGIAIDHLVLNELVQHYEANQRSWRDSRGNLMTRARIAKEHLSTHNAVTLDHVAGRPLQMSRSDFEWLIGDQVHEAAEFARTVFAKTSRQPEMIALIGGGANIPAMRSGLQEQLGVRTVVIDEPEAVIAKGAALIADSPQHVPYPVISLAADEPTGTFTKVSAVLFGALLVVGLIIGYGVPALKGNTGNNISPAGSHNEQTVPTPPSTVPLPPPSSSSSTPAPPSGAPAPTATESDSTTEPPGAADATTRPVPAPVPTAQVARPAAPEPVPTSTVAATVPSGTSSEPPTLRPAPNLPSIPWPEWLPPPVPATGG